MLSNVELFETLTLLFALRCTGCVAWDFLLDVKTFLRPATLWLVMSGKEFLEYSGFFDPSHGVPDEAHLILEFEKDRAMSLLKSAHVIPRIVECAAGCWI